MTVVDAAPGAAAAAVERIGAALSRLVDKGRLPADDAAAVLARITPEVPRPLVTPMTSTSWPSVNDVALTSRTSASD